MLFRFFGREKTHLKTWGWTEVASSKLPPFLRDVELVIMSLILVLMAGYLGQREGALGVGGSGVAGCRYFEAILPAKNWATATKKKSKGSLWLDMQYWLRWMPGFLFHVFLKIIPNFSLCRRCHPVYTYPKQRNVFFFHGSAENLNSWWLKVTFLGWWNRDPFKGLSDLQLGDEKGTLNHLVRVNFWERHPPK